MRRAAAAALLAAACLALDAAAGDPARPSRDQDGPAPLPMLEGTWELVSLAPPGGPRLVPPQATGAIVVDHDRYVAASYLQAGPGRHVGSLWEGRLTVADGRFRVVPTTGMRHDSAAEPANVAFLPPKAEGTIEITDGEVVFRRSDGGVVSWRIRDQSRTQTEPDGTVIVHRRTSLVPGLPEALRSRR